MQECDSPTKSFYVGETKLHFPANMFVFIRLVQVSLGVVLPPPEQREVVHSISGWRYLGQTQG